MGRHLVHVVIEHYKYKQALPELTYFEIPFYDRISTFSVLIQEINRAQLIQKISKQH